MDVLRVPPEQNLQNGMRALAKILSGPLTDEALEDVYDKVCVAQDDFEALVKAARDRVLSVLLERGKMSEESKTRTLEFPNRHVLKAVPHRTGFDPKKLESLLRVKGLDPQVHMTPTVSFKVDYIKTDMLQAEGKATADELETCRYPESYRIVRGEARSEMPTLNEGENNE